MKTWKFIKPNRTHRPWQESISWAVWGKTSCTVLRGGAGNWSNPKRQPFTRQVVFYEQKTFWSFGNYMLRSVIGIDNYVNILNICYSATKLLPWLNKDFANLKTESPQSIKYILSQYIHQDMLFATFASDSETLNNSIPSQEPLIRGPLYKKCSGWRWFSCKVV